MLKACLLTFKKDDTDTDHTEEYNQVLVKIPFYWYINSKVFSIVEWDELGQPGQVV